jgi:hypothetical protein
MALFRAAERHCSCLPSFCVRAYRKAASPHLYCISEPINAFLLMFRPCTVLCNDAHIILQSGDLIVYTNS